VHIAFTLVIYQLIIFHIKGQRAHSLHISYISSLSFTSWNHVHITFTFYISAHYLSRHGTTCTLPSHFIYQLIIFHIKGQRAYSPHISYIGSLSFTSRNDVHIAFTFHISAHYHLHYGRVFIICCLRHELELNQSVFSRSIRISEGLMLCDVNSGQLKSGSSRGSLKLLSMYLIFYIHAMKVLYMYSIEILLIWCLSSLVIINIVPVHL